jgi:hypothetical protein
VFHRKQLTEPSKPLYGFDGKIIEPVESITLSISFGTPQNPRTKYITFDVVDMPYPYNAIFRRGILNTFEAALHSAYLCLKVPVTSSVISIFGSQLEARNNEKGFMPGHKNVHFLWKQLDQHEVGPMAEYKNIIDAKGEFKKVTLDLRVLDKTVCIGVDASQEEQTKILSFLDKNSDVFALSTLDLLGVSRDVIEHQLQVNPSARPKK